MYKGDVLLESSKWPISKDSIFFFKLINKFRIDWIKNKFTPCKPNDLIPDFLLLYLNKEFWISAKNYEKAIDSYIEAHKIHPYMKSPMIMIQKLQIELQKQAI